MIFTEKDALNIAKFCATNLGIPNDKKIQILFSGEHKFASAQVRVLKDGKEIPDYAEEDAIALYEFDTIEITLFDIDKFKLPRWVYTQLFISRILHELLHIRYPEWEEEEIKDEEARLIGLMMEELEAKEKKE